MNLFESAARCTTKKLTGSYDDTFAKVSKTKALNRRLNIFESIVNCCCVLDGIRGQGGNRARKAHFNRLHSQPPFLKPR